MTTESKVVIHNNKALLIEETVQREVTLKDYLSVLKRSSPHISRKTFRLPSNCIGSSWRDLGDDAASGYITVLISVPSRKQVSSYKEKRISQHSVMKNDYASVQRGEVLLPHLIFKIGSMVHRRNGYPSGHQSVKLFTKLSPEPLDSNTRVTPARLPNVESSGEICFGTVNVYKDGSLDTWAQHAISAYLLSEGNDDYTNCLPYPTFGEWVKATKNEPRDCVLRRIMQSHARRREYRLGALLD